MKTCFLNDYKLVLLATLIVCSLTALSACTSCPEPYEARFDSIEDAKKYVESCRFDYSVAIAQRIGLSIYSTNIPQWLEELDKQGIVTIRLRTRGGVTDNWKQQRYRVFSDYFEITTPRIRAEEEESGSSTTMYMYVENEGDPDFRKSSNHIITPVGTFVANEVSVQGYSLYARGHLVDIETYPEQFGLDPNNISIRFQLEEEYGEGGKRVYIIKHLFNVKAWSEDHWNLMEIRSFPDEDDQ